MNDKTWILNENYFHYLSLNWKCHHQHRCMGLPSILLFQWMSPFSAWLNAWEAPLRTPLASSWVRYKRMRTAHLCILVYCSCKHSLIATLIDDQYEWKFWQGAFSLFLPATRAAIDECIAAGVNVWLWLNFNMQFSSCNMYVWLWA